MNDDNRVTPAMETAYVGWEPPADLPDNLTAGQTARVLGLVRSAFMAGWKAHEEFRVQTIRETQTLMAEGRWTGRRFTEILPRPIWAGHGSFAPEIADVIALYPPRVRRMIAGDIGFYDRGGLLPDYDRGPITEAWLFDPERKLRPMAYGDLFAGVPREARPAWLPWRRWAIVEAHG